MKISNKLNLVSNKQNLAIDASNFLKMCSTVGLKPSDFIMLCKDIPGLYHPVFTYEPVSRQLLQYQLGYDLYTDELEWKNSFVPITVLLENKERFTINPHRQYIDDLAVTHYQLDLCDFKGPDKPRVKGMVFKLVNKIRSA